MASTISFQGITSGLKTDDLVNAIMQQEGQGVQRLKDRQTLNNSRAAALKTFQTNLTGLASSLLSLSATSFNTRTVSSSDASATYVTATASGAANGTYEVAVSQLATKGRLGGVDAGDGTYTLSSATTTGAIFNGETATFAVQGTDGVVKSVSLSTAAGTNSLQGLRDAINASGAGVTASLVNTGTGSKPYQLVLTAKESGVGTTGGVVTLAETSQGGPLNTLGIALGSLVLDNEVPTGIQGGTRSSTAAQNARFTINGVQLERSSNLVTDAVEGVSFTLKKGGQDAGTPTILTVNQDKSAVTAAMQDVVNKYNTLVQHYKTASTSTKDSEGSIKVGALGGDASTRLIMNQVRSALVGSATDLPQDATFTSPASVGIKTNRDGTLSLDTAAFQAALDKDPEAVKKVFAFSGTSSNSVVSFTSGTSKTQTGSVGFQITDYAQGGSLAGTLTFAGQTYGATGMNGVLNGPVGSPLEGLTLSVRGPGSGTLALSRGVGQTVQDLVAGLTSYDGTLTNTLENIQTQNTNLDKQIAQGQSLLDRRKAALQLQFSQMESTISQLRAASGSLGNLA